MIQARFTRSFAAAHRVWNDPGACCNIHGHNYTADITVQGDKLDEAGFLIPFDAIKEVVDAYDHALLLHEIDPIRSLFHGLDLRVVAMGRMPTTENLAQRIADHLVDRHPWLKVSVTLREGPSIEATAWA